MHSEQETPSHVLDLEARLASDESGEVLQNLTRTFESELSDVKQQMNVGLTPDAWQAAEQYAAGLQAAADVVTAVWKREHSGTASPYSPLQHFG